MPLEPGTRLGPYQVTAKIGEGGMGEVYRARDTTLDRDVALKVLPEAFTQDPDRLAWWWKCWEPRRSYRTVLQSGGLWVSTLSISTESLTSKH